MFRDNSFLPAIFLIVIGIIGLTLILTFDTFSSVQESLENRISLLEEKMIERVKPVIQINRATIYNTEGEIVIEVLEDKK